jgi:hypothetical protein
MFSTGEGNLNTGDTDPNYRFIYTPHGKEFNAIVIQSPYHENDVFSKFIGLPDGVDNVPGIYHVKTNFQLGPEVNTSFVTVSINIAVDNMLQDVLINNMSTGLSTVATILWEGEAYKITSGFKQGENELRFIIQNYPSTAPGNKVGLRVLIKGTARNI